jgi:predicted GIY-YIG superfamily endonuclease
MKDATGTVYLLHLSRPFGHARHYIGFTEDLEQRLAHHAAGKGSLMLARARAAGITWQLARTWPGTRARETQLKKQGGRSRLCPLCTQARAC